ncbi:hypothetical protein [Streptomyces sp. URMC 125]|uniref:hypothetical protein n=1 Tax=Streptomyces sp. URMC 125 TaxID=3423419 RepID=UPI003F1BD112
MKQDSKAEKKPGSAARLRVELRAADRVISFVTWGVTAGMVLWSMLNATPYVAAHVTPGWEKIAFVLPLVVDLAFVGALRADEIASRYGASGGVWAALLRLFTGAASVFLNVGHSWEKGDWTGVAQHLIAPGILVLMAEAGPAYRRRLGARLTAAEVEEQQKAEAERERDQAEAERQRKQRQEEEDRKREQQRQEEDRRRRQAQEDEDRRRRQEWEDEQRRLDAEERREANRAARELQAKKLDLDAKRLEITAARPGTREAIAGHSHGDGTTANRHNGMTAASAGVAPQPTRPAPAAVRPVERPAVPAPAPRPATAPQPRTQPSVAAREAEVQAAAAARSPLTPDAAPARPQGTDQHRPAPVAASPASASAVSPAAQNGPARVTARVEDEHQEQPPAPARPPRDWELPGLPAECAPGIDPALITDDQARARIVYGLTKTEWTQRRIGEFAGRSATTVNKVKAKL